MAAAVDGSGNNIFLAVGERIPLASWSRRTVPSSEMLCDGGMEFRVEKLDIHH
jgi:hypothetical protein